MAQFPLSEYIAFYLFGEYCQNHGTTKVNIYLFRKWRRIGKVKKTWRIIEWQTKKKNGTEEEKKRKINVDAHEFPQNLSKIKTSSERIFKATLIHEASPLEGKLNYQITLIV